MQKRVDGQRTTETVQHVRSEPRPLVASDLRVGLALEHRKKGLLWYPTYEADFDGRYALPNDGDERRATASATGSPRGLP